MRKPLSSEGLTFPLFGPLDASDGAALAPLLRLRRYEAGRLLFQRGDDAENVIQIVAGQLRISVFSLDGRELAFRMAGPGEIVGEIGVLDGGRRSADVTAVRASEVLTLARADLQRLLTSRPGMAIGVSRFLCGRLRETSEQLEAQAFQRVEGRLARFLVRQMSVNESSSDEVEITLGVSQSEIAALIGASRPKVNVAFSALEERGAVRRQGKKTMKCRRAALLEIADPFIAC
jgi:CRP-like cAMP-binding protein